ncbi:hypothetical protein SAMN05421759_1171, partial [Roseivivax lentus]
MSHHDPNETFAPSADFVSHAHVDAAK